MPPTLPFTEKHHAFISASFYRNLKAEASIDGKALFELATRRYGEQRGCRMAQRVLRDGRVLDFAAYTAYAEWNYTDEYFQSGKHTEILSRSPDYHYQVQRCRWHDQYMAMGLIEGAILYCRQIDQALVRGFNPALVLELREIMHTGRCCDFVLKAADLETRRYSVDPATTRLPFEYHCGHIFTTFSRIIKSVLGRAGISLCDRVAREFSAEFDDAMLSSLLRWADTDFEILP